MTITTTRAEIMRTLKTQRKIEPDNKEIPVLEELAKKLKTASQWGAATSIVWHRYGKMSYECHKIYRLSPLFHIINQMPRLANETEAQSSS